MINSMIRWSFHSAMLLAISVPVMALPPAPAPDQSRPILIHNVNIHTGNGDLVMGGAVSFADGVITGVFDSESAPDPAAAGVDFEVVNGNGELLYPGFILPNTRLGLTEINSVRATRDEIEEGGLNPSVRALVAYNTDSELIPTYRFNGVLTAQTTPRGKLLAGTSSIVQLDAWNWQDAALRADDGMHIYWPRQFRTETDYVRRTVQYKANKSYAGDVEKLEALFAAASIAGDTPNLKLAAVKPVLTGERRLFIHASKAKEIGDAIGFADQFGLEIVLVGAEEALSVKEMIVERNIPVIVQFVHGRPALDDDPIDQNFTRPADFMAAGFKIGLAAKIRMEPATGRDLPFMAGTAAAYGLTPEQAVMLITRHNAEILGLGNELGTIEVGKRATLFVSRGDALDPRSNFVTHAFIDGRRVATRGTQQELYERFREKYSSRSGN